MTANQHVAGQEILEALAAPFKDNEIEWRAQTFSSKGNGVQVLVLPYIESRAAMNRLDDIVGANWKDEYTVIEINGQKAFQCAISIKIDDEWITRTDGAEATDFESVKGGYSSAFKRAAVKWKIGRSLYDLPKIWLPLQQTGQVYVSGKDKNKNFYSGFVNPPSIIQLLNQRGQSSQPQSQQPRQGNHNQPQQQVNDQQQRPNNQQQQPQGNQNQQQHDQNNHKIAIDLVVNLISELGIGQNLVNSMLEKVGSQAKSIHHASIKELENLFHVLKPVHDFTRVCRQANLSLDRILYYAKIALKKEIHHFEELLFAMNYESGGEAIKLVLGDQVDQRKQQAQ
ncbi:hypothetical protein D7X33_19000 [Butyricicoccus sp. 1XD8-22]|nr:hypothetical protein D7X33_19000 [Butyricicoccus sp. 1XD8-22]